jgi:hypothetical protein
MGKNLFQVFNEPSTYMGMIPNTIYPLLGELVPYKSVMNRKLPRFNLLNETRGGRLCRTFVFDGAPFNLRTLWRYMN